jgi:hypothetical protein
MSAIWATDRPPIELQNRERPAQQPGIRGVIKLVLQCASGRALIGKSCIAVPSEQTEKKLQILCQRTYDYLLSHSFDASQPAGDDYVVVTGFACQPVAVSRSESSRT